MSDETTLLLCPFCGGEADNRWRYRKPGEDACCWVLCVRCGCATTAYDTEAEAIAAWNTRAEHGTLTVEQVRESIERNFGKVAVLDDGKPVEWRDDWVCKVGIDYKGIADELNELGSGTCKLEPLSALDVTLNMLDQTEWGACSECGCAVPMDARFCNECGKAVSE